MIFLLLGSNQGNQKRIPTCSFFNQTPLPEESSHKSMQRNEIWQMTVFHFTEF